MPSTEKDIEAIVKQLQAQNDLKNGPVLDNDWIPLGLWNGSAAWDMTHQIGGDGSAAKPASRETLATVAKALADYTPWNDHGGNNWKTKSVTGPDGHTYAMTSDHPDAVLDQNTNRAYLIRNGTLVPALQRLTADGKVEIVETKDQGAHAGHKDVPAAAKADIETIQADLQKRGLYHYEVEGDWGSRTNRGLEKLIVQAQIAGQKDGSYTGKVNGGYNQQTRAAMVKMDVSQETLGALDRLQSTNQLQALYKPSGDPMLYKTAGVTAAFQQNATVSTPTPPATSATTPAAAPSTDGSLKAKDAIQVIGAVLPIALRNQ